MGFNRRNPKPENRNPKPTAKVGFKRRNPKPETRNPKPTAKVGFNRRNPKPETDSESWFQATKPETRNPKPETDSESWFQSTKPETRNPKPETRNRLESDFWVALRIGTPMLNNQRVKCSENHMLCYVIMLCSPRSNQICKKTWDATCQKLEMSTNRTVGFNVQNAKLKHQKREHGETIQCQMGHCGPLQMSSTPH